MKAGDVRKGGVENIISVNYDETGEKWATNRGQGHELWRKLQMINFKVETLGFSCRTGSGSSLFPYPGRCHFFEPGVGEFSSCCFCVASGKWKIICERKFSWWDTKLWLHELVCDWVFGKMLSRKCTFEGPASEAEPFSLPQVRPPRKGLLINEIV